MRVVLTKLYFCLCVMDSEVSLSDGHFCDWIVFDVWYVSPTLGMFFGVILGLVPTLGGKNG